MGSNKKISSFGGMVPSEHANCQSLQNQIYLFLAPDRDLQIALLLDSSGNFIERQIDRVRHTTFLGLMLDENLIWSFHIDSISRKIAKWIGILYRARHYLNFDISGL